MRKKFQFSSVRQCSGSDIDHFASHRKVYDLKRDAVFEHQLCRDRFVHGGELQLARVGCVVLDLFDQASAGVWGAWPLGLIGLGARLVAGNFYEAEGRIQDGGPDLDAQVVHVIGSWHLRQYLAFGKCLGVAWHHATESKRTTSIVGAVKLPFLAS